MNWVFSVMLDWRINGGCPYYSCVLEESAAWLNLI